MWLCIPSPCAQASAASTSPSSLPALASSLPPLWLRGKPTHAACILAARMQDKAIPACPVWSDVRTVCDAGFRAYVRERTSGQGIDFVYGGIPCQPHSVAGKQLGAADERDLWPATVRILETYRPWLFFLENVPGMLEYVSARAVPDLRRLGYVVPRPLLFEAAEVGAPQRRERLFVLAYHQRGRFGERADNAKPRQRKGVRGQSPESDCCTVANAWGRDLERWRDAGDMASKSGQVEGEGHQRQRRGDAPRDSGPAMADAALGELRQPSGSGGAVGKPSGGRRRKRLTGGGKDRGEAARRDRRSS